MEVLIAAACLVGGLWFMRKLFRDQTHATGRVQVRHLPRHMSETGPLQGTKTSRLLIGYEDAQGNYTERIIQVDAFGLFFRRWPAPWLRVGIRPLDEGAPHSRPCVSMETAHGFGA